MQDYRLHAKGERTACELDCRVAAGHGDAATADKEHCYEPSHGSRDREVVEVVGSFAFVVLVLIRRRNRHDAAT